VEDNVKVFSVSASLKFLQAHVMERRCYLLTYIYLPCVIVEFLYHSVKIHFYTYYGICSVKVYIYIYIFFFFGNKVELVHKFWKKYCWYVKVLSGDIKIQYVPENKMTHSASHSPTFRRICM
jgi:hypothetical protein